LERICHFVLYRSFEQDLSSLCWAIDVDLIVIVAIVLLGWVRIQGSKWPESQFPGAERSGREGDNMGQVEGFGNGQVDATIRVIFRVAEHVVME
jgi:hypothetical protein